MRTQTDKTVNRIVNILLKTEQPMVYVIIEKVLQEMELINKLRLETEKGSD